MATRISQSGINFNFQSNRSQNFGAVRVKYHPFPLTKHITYIHSFIHFWHAPLWECSTKHTRFWAMSFATFRERFNDFSSCWVVFIDIVWGHPGGLLQFSKGEAVKICLASDSSGICTVLPNMERRCGWTVAERCGCSVFCLTSSFRTWWFRLIPNSFRRHQWLRASILCTSLLVTAQHSETYREMGRMQVSCSFNLVNMNKSVECINFWRCRMRNWSSLSCWKCWEVSDWIMPRSWLRMM